MTATEKYQEFKRNYEEAKQGLQNSAREAFKDLTKEYFEKFPYVTEFSWTQYTPYFNDGDACHFRVRAYEDQMGINGVGYYPEESDLEDAGLTKEQYESAAEAAAKLVGDFDDDLLQSIYGDHAEITVHSDGKVVVDEYEHD